MECAMKMPVFPGCHPTLSLNASECARAFEAWWVLKSYAAKVNVKLQSQKDTKRHRTG